MKKVLALVEGPTEEAVFNQVFMPDLAAKDIFIYPRVVGKPGHQGGNNFEVVLSDLTVLLKHNPESIITMFFDYYGLNDDWPGVAEAKGKKANEAFKIVTESIASAIASEFDSSFNPARFIPYIQFYELEGLLFAGPDKMAEVFEKPGLKVKFEQIVKDCGGCEKINNNYDTAPSKRIHQEFSGYKKGRSVNAHAYRILQRIGVEGIRQACPNFNGWVTRLENLNT